MKTLINKVKRIFSGPKNEYVEYQKKLWELGHRQLDSSRAGSTTYKLGADFKTNQPLYRIMKGRRIDDATAEINKHLDSCFYYRVFTGTSVLKGFKDLEFDYLMNI